MRYPRLLLKLWAIALSEYMEYRSRFVIEILAGLAQMGLALLTFAILFQFTPTLAGWSQAQVFMLVGFYRFVDGMLFFQFLFNLWNLPSRVNDGELDGVLLLPISSRFVMSTSGASIPNLFNAASGLLLVFLASRSAGTHWTVAGVAEATLLLGCGVTILYSLWFAIGSMCFWAPKMDNLTELFWTVYSTAQYPVDFFPSALRAILIVVAPVAFATTFPAEAVAGRLDPWLLVLGAGLAAIALAASGLIWVRGLRRYASASS